MIIEKTYRDQCFKYPLLYYSLCRKIVVIAVQDDGSRYISAAIEEIKRLGGYRITSTFRGSYALVGYSGKGRPLWVTQRQARRYRGPSTVSSLIKLNQYIRPAVVRPGKMVPHEVFSSLFFNINVFRNVNHYS